MKNFVLLLLVTLLGSTSIYAQQVYTPSNVKADANIEQLLKLHTAASRNRTVAGYRVQINQETNRDLVRGEKVLLLQQYPNLKTYEVYQSPYFKVRAGDFTNRLAAFKLYSDLKPMFKRCIIVPDRVLSDL